MPVIENVCPENGKNPNVGLEEDDPLDQSALLTVQVESPDGGEQQLVQFSSLTAATAIKKGLGGAVSLFKRRVYRGADLHHPKIPDTALGGINPETVFSGDIKLQSPQLQKTETAMSDNNMPGHKPRIPDDELGEEGNEAEWTILPSSNNDDQSLAVPASQFDEIDRNPREQGEANNDNHIDHLVLIVHGIGEMLQSVDIFGLNIPNLSSIIDCCGFLRKNHTEVQRNRYSQMYQTAESTSTATTGRVEYLPVEWHEAFSILSQRRSPGVSPVSSEGQLVRAERKPSQVMMNDISLRTIPQLRGFANDTLMDVLYFMSSEHHDVIIDIVATEMNVVAQKFRALTGFTGKVSVIGHSLGSIILWDLLANQSPAKDMAESFVPESLYSSNVSGLDFIQTKSSDEWEDMPAYARNDSISTDGDESPPDQNTNTTCYFETAVTQDATDEVLRNGTPTHDNNDRKPGPSRDPGAAEFPPLPKKWQYPKLLFDVDNAFMLGSPIAGRSSNLEENPLA